MYCAIPNMVVAYIQHRATAAPHGPPTQRSSAHTITRCPAQRSGPFPRGRAVPSTHAQHTLLSRRHRPAPHLTLRLHGHRQQVRQQRSHRRRRGLKLRVTAIKLCVKTATHRHVPHTAVPSHAGRPIQTDAIHHTGRWRHVRCNKAQHILLASNQGAAGAGEAEARASVQAVESRRRCSSSRER